jgi:hypothetical protein
VKINNVAQFALGLLFVLSILYLIFQGYSLSIFNIIYLLGGIFFIMISIFEGKHVPLLIGLSLVIFITVFVWLITQQAPWYSKDVLVSIVVGIFFLITGILAHLDIIPEK